MIVSDATPRGLWHTTPWRRARQLHLLLTFADAVNEEEP